MSVTIATTIHYKGKDYASLDELPPEARADYQNNSAGLCAGTLNNGLPTRLIFNTEKFQWPGHLPEAQRELVDDFARYARQAEVLTTLARQLEQTRAATAAAAQQERCQASRVRLLLLIGAFVMAAAMVVMFRLTTW